MITILMPIYNGIEFINDSVLSVLTQTYSNWELLIGINGHTINSNIYQKALEYQRMDSRINVLDLYYIKGKSNALNEMLYYSKYDWISLLDVDDKWLPDKLEKQVEYMSNYDIIGSTCRYLGDSTIVPIIPTGDISNFNFLEYNPVINSSCLVKKDLCIWDGDYDGVEDYDLWLRLRFNKKKYYNLDDILVLHRIHNTSAFNSKGNNLLVDKLKEKYKKIN